MTTMLNVSSAYMPSFCGFQWFCVTLTEQMTSFKMADKILWILGTLQGLNKNDMENTMHLARGAAGTPSDYHMYQGPVVVHNAVTGRTRVVTLDQLSDTGHQYVPMIPVHGIPQSQLPYALGSLPCGVDYYAGHGIENQCLDTDLVVAQYEHDAGEEPHGLDCGKEMVADTDGKIGSGEFIWMA